MTFLFEKGRLNFELRHLRYVLAAAEQESFRRAARSLAVEPSTVSRRIRDLEDNIGVALFIRGRGGVRLTVAGERFIQTARKALSQLANATLDVGDIGRGQAGVVRIGLMSSMASGFIAELVDAYAVNHAQVQIEYIEGEASDHVPAIQRYRMDIAFLTGTPSAEDCDLAHLWNERVYVAMASTHDLAEKDEIIWDELRGREFIVSAAQAGPEIYHYLVKHLSELGDSPNIRRHAVYRDTLMQIVASGGSLTLTSEATIATQFPGVVYRPLAGELLSFCAVWSPKNDNPAFRRLLSLAKVISERSGRSPNGVQTLFDEASQILDPSQ